MGKQKRKPSSRILNLRIAGILGVVGCLNIIIALSALLLGLWIDGLFGWRGIATVLLLVVSFPVSLYLMVRVALMLTRRLGASANPHVADSLPQNKEE